MPLNSRGQRVNNHNMKKQKEMAKALRKPSTGGTSGGAAIGGAGGA